VNRCERCERSDEVASRAASLLTGKTRPDYTPNQDTGDFVVIINAAKVRLTGSKPLSKQYQSAYRMARRNSHDHCRQDASRPSRNGCWRLQ